MLLSVENHIINKRKSINWNFSDIFVEMLIKINIINKIKSIIKI